jgi:hypothetical protein
MRIATVEYAGTLTVVVNPPVIDFMLNEDAAIAAWVLFSRYFVANTAL